MKHNHFRLTIDIVTQEPVEQRDLLQAMVDSCANEKMPSGQVYASYARPLFSREDPPYGILLFGLVLP